MAADVFQKQAGGAAGGRKERGQAARHGFWRRPGPARIMEEEEYGRDAYAPWVNGSCGLAWAARSRDSRGMDLLEQARRVIGIERDGLERMAGRLDGSFERAVEILGDTLRQRGKIVVVGIGKSGNIGHKIAATFNSTGAVAVVLNSQNALHGDLGVLADGDAVIALSYSGETAELLDLLPHIKRFDVRLIALTGRVDSTLGEHSDVVLDTSVEREACPLNLAPTSSSTSMLVMGDALAMVLLETRGFTEE